LAFDRSSDSAPVSKLNEEFRGFAKRLASGGKFATHAMYVAQVGKRPRATPAIVTLAKHIKRFTIQIMCRFDAILLQFKVTRLINGPRRATVITAFTEHRNRFGQGRCCTGKIAAHFGGVREVV
jgi:hypothetical protein